MGVKTYPDDYEIELGDRVEVASPPFPPEMAVVKKIGKTRLYVEYEVSAYISHEWVEINDCTMLARG